MQISNLIGKRILSPSGENLGYVLNVYLTRDMKKVSSLLCADEDEEEYFLSARSVLSFGDALIAGKSRLPAATGQLSPLSCAVYSHLGESLGAVTELDTEHEPAFAVFGDGIKETFPLSRVALGDALVVYPEGMKKPPVRKAAPRPKISAEKPVAPATNALPAELFPPSFPEPAQVRAPAQTYVPVNGEYSLNRLNLIGRRVKKSVYDEEGNPIARAGDRITPDVVSAARRNNRLLQLTVNTLTNIES